MLQWLARESVYETPRRGIVDVDVVAHGISPYVVIALEGYGKALDNLM